MANGIGMPRCMPRSKRTGKPQRHIYDLLQLAKRGDIAPEDIKLTDDSATISHNNMLCMISRARYDEFMSADQKSNIVIKIAPSWLDVHREQLP
jgi:hypothetical protein